MLWEEHQDICNKLEKIFWGKAYKWQISARSSQCHTKAPQDALMGSTGAQWQQRLGFFQVLPLKIPFQPMDRASFGNESEILN